MKGRHYPNMPPLLDGEDNGHYSNRLIGVYGEDQIPYDHRRNRQCALGWHNECSERTIIDADDRRCQCPCHSPDASLPPADVRQPRSGEEELAAMDARHAPIPHMTDGVSTPLCRCNHRWPCPTSRLITDLRAKNAIESGLREMLRSAETQLDAARKDGRASRAEVERLREAASHVPPAPYALTDNAGLVWLAGYRAACKRILEVPPTLT